MDLIDRKPVIVLIAGKARSGKSTLANYLKRILEKDNKRVIFSPYTKYLKQYIEDIMGEKIDEKYKPRYLLQNLSSELIKKKLGWDKFFIDRQLEDLKVYSYFADVIIVPDVRFMEELEVVKKVFDKVLTVRVNRENYVSDLTEEEKKDITEVALDDYHCYDYEFFNQGLTNLVEFSKQLALEIEERR